MKKTLLILASAVLLASCGNISQIPQIEDKERKVYVMFQDFRPFEEQGFLITPNTYTGEYSACGLLAIYVTPERKVTYNRTPGQTNNYGNYEVGYTTVTVDTEEISSQEIISIAVEKAKELGADVISNFSYSVEYGAEDAIILYKVSGFCVKRK